MARQLASLRLDAAQRRPRERRLWRLAIIAVALAAAAAAGWSGWRRVGAAVLEPEVEVTPVTFVTPTQASAIVTTSGFVVARRSSKVAVPTAGRVVAVHAREGDQVAEGALLLELDAGEQRSAARAAAGALKVADARAEAARASLEEIRLQIDRQRPLTDAGIKPRATLEDLEARARALDRSYHAARLEAEAAATQAQDARRRIEQTKITAPIGGTIVAAIPQVGELVGPSVGGAIEIADFASLVIETDVPEPKLQSLAPKAHCEIVFEAYPLRTYQGRLLEIGRRVDRAKATVTARVELVGETRDVLPNMSARVTFLSRPAEELAREPAPRAVVPATAVVEHDGGKAVFVVEGDRALVVPVRVGAPFGEGLELVQGPAPSARVVVRPPPALRHGQRIRERRAE
jgi:RND family efflux transporter MFP subunit